MCDYVKKNYIITGLIIGLIGIILIGIMLFNERPVEDELPLLVRVDGVLYQYYDDILEQPTEDVNGYIVEIVSGVIPTDDKTANFGKVGMPYWKDDNGICIWLNDILWLLEPIQE